MSEDQGPVTVLTRGREVTITPEELEAELAAEGPCRSLAHVEAVARANDRERAVTRLERAVAALSTSRQELAQGALDLADRLSPPDVDATVTLADVLSAPPTAPVAVPVAGPAAAAPVPVPVSVPAAPPR